MVKKNEQNVKLCEHLICPCILLTDFLLYPSSSDAGVGLITTNPNELNQTCFMHCGVLSLNVDSCKS